MLKTHGINICDSKHDKVREVLLEHSIAVYNFLYDQLYTASISNKSSNSSSNGRKQQHQQRNQLRNRHVTISSPEYFLELIESYKYDPCLNNTTPTMGAAVTATEANMSTATT